MRPTCPFPCQQEPTAGTYPEGHEVSPRLQIGFGPLSVFVRKTVLEIWKSRRKKLDGNFLPLEKVTQPLDIFNFPISVARTRQMLRVCVTWCRVCACKCSMQIVKPLFRQRYCACWTREMSFSS